MLLAIDIGNTAIKFGVFDGKKLTSSFSIPTKRDNTADKIAQLIGHRLQTSVKEAIACSVVPEVEKAVTELVSQFLHCEVRFVRSTDDLGLKVNFQVDTTGTDRLVNSFAAAEKYGVPCVVVSFGTATTIDVVNKDREYLGGLIAPGMKVNAKALSLAASKLPEVELKKPESVIAKTTETAIQSGIVNGHIEMVEGLLKRVAEELGDKPAVIATGGFARLLSPGIDRINKVEENLTLIGLSSLYDRWHSK
jgi:type III pantothenate kinase